MLKWIKAHPVLVALIVAGIGTAVAFFVNRDIALGIGIGAVIALGISWLAAGEAPWSD